ncbi:MAG TPA: hypothetical protein ENJ09_14055 [Planctomycetes bacterium]|nr:hypothetical protein [Planctomycetota bacterium]
MQPRLSLFLTALLAASSAVGGFGSSQELGGVLPSEALGLAPPAVLEEVDSFGTEELAVLDWTSEDHGAWEPAGSGRVWRLALSSPGAARLGLILDGFQVPPGAELYAHGGGVVRGAYTSLANDPDGLLVIEPVPGDRLVVEYFEPAGALLPGTLHLSVLVREQETGKKRRRRAGHKPAAEHAREDTEADPPSRDRHAAACNVDLACPEGEPWRTSARAIVRIVAVREKCTGVLINNTARDGTPYILTAAHCGDLHNASFYFNYLADACGGEEPRTREDRLSGSVPVVVEDLLDLQLVRLLDTPPASFHVLYAGWDRTGAVPKSVTTLHHPAGDVMKISIEKDPPRKVKSLFKIPHWDVGITERGSSGAPLFDPAHRVIGHLQGGSATCDKPSGDQYRRLEKDWVLLEPYLDPLGVGPETLDAFDPDRTPERFTLSLAAVDVDPSSSRTLHVRGTGFSPQLHLLLDGNPLPPTAGRYLTNSLFTVTLPEPLAPGAHELAAVLPSGPDSVAIQFDVGE